MDAEARYLDALHGESDPEARCKIIGRLFVEIFDEESARLGDARWLAQGTIDPDVIESAGSKTGKAHVISSHHNVGGLPECAGLAGFFSSKRSDSVQARAKSTKPRPAPCPEQSPPPDLDHACRR